MTYKKRVAFPGIFVLLFLTLNGVFAQQRLVTDTNPSDADAINCDNVSYTHANSNCAPSYALYDADNSYALVGYVKPTILSQATSVNVEWLASGSSIDSYTNPFPRFRHELTPGASTVRWDFFDTDGTTPKSFSFNVLIGDLDGTRNETITVSSSEIESFTLSENSNLTYTNNGDGTLSFLGTTNDDTEDDAILISYSSVSSINITYENTDNGSTGSSGYNHDFYTGITYFSSPTTDSDLDGVMDAVDLDDDNDGIPDTEECSLINNMAIYHLYDPSTPLSSGDFNNIYLQDNSINSSSYVDVENNGGNSWATTTLLDDINNLAYDDGVFYYLSGGDLYTFTDVTGSATNLGDANLGSGVDNLAYDNGTFYHLFNSSGTIQLYSSTDPLSGWTLEGNTSLSAAQMDGLAVHDGVFYALDDEGGDNHTYYSTFTPLQVGAWTSGGDPEYGTNVANFAIGNVDFSTFCDKDGDGVYNHLNLDSDNDGIADIIEAGGTDSDGDGQVDYGTAGDPTTMTDADNDGLADALDDQDSGSGGGEVTSGTALSNLDSDSDGVKDMLDIDSDNDGITDNVEAQTTAGYTAPTGTDSDGDGIDNAYDGDDQQTLGIGSGTGTTISPTDTDSDATVDYLDSDSDRTMAIDDSIEGHDSNGDGTVDGSDSPNANTGLAGGTTDADEDGLYDGFDNNTASWDATNGSLTAESHPDIQTGGTSEQDWREGPDWDLDGVPNSDDLDDDNDGILDADECDMSLSTSNVDFTGLSTSGGSYDTDDAANTLFTTTVSASTFTPGTGDDNTYDVRAATGNSTTGMRYEEGADGTIGSTVSNTLSFSRSIPVELRAGSTYGGVNSIMNRSGDRFVWEAVGASEGFTWVVNNAVFPGGGGSATVSGDGRTLTIEAGAGTGSANQAQFYVSTNGTLTGINVSMETIATLTGVINAAQFSLRIPLLCDADGDGIFNDFDLDSDADGIADIIEAGGTDSDGDGQVDYGTAGDPSTMTDADGDGLFDTVDDQDSGAGGSEVTSGTALSNPDSDSDGLIDLLDIDSDNDGITDNVEAQTTAGYTAPSGSDTDGDGIDNAYDGDDNTTTGIGGGQEQPFPLPILTAMPSMTISTVIQTMTE